MSNKKQEIEVGTLYELNQQILNQLPAQPQEHLQRQFKYIKNWIIDKQCQYYMLLCREKADYTLFNIDLFKSFNLKYAKSIDFLTEVETIVGTKTIQELQECIKNRGTLMSISKALEDAWEIWIKDFYGNVNVYMLFECGPMVIEV